MSVGRTPTRRSLARPFLLLFVAAGLLFLGIGASLYVVQRAEQRRAAQLSHHLTSTIELNYRLETLADDHVRLLVDALRAPEPGRAERLTELHFRSGHLVQRYLNLAEALEERRAVESIRGLQFELARRIQYAIQVTARDGAGAEVVDQALATTKQLDAALDELSRLSSSRLRAALERTLVFEHVLAAVEGLVIMLAFCATLLLLLRRRVLRRLESMVAVADRVAEADYSVRLDPGPDDEIGRLSRRINEMVDRLGALHGSLEEQVEERTRQLRQAQAQLVQAEKMSAVGQLVSGVAHELNNPMTAIVGYAELAKNDVDAERGRLERYCDAILDAADRCKRIVYNLLQFARQRETRREPVDLGRVAVAATELFRHSARTAEIELEVNVPQGRLFVVGDLHKLQQVVLVLLNNASDAVRELLPRRQIRFSLRRDGSAAVLEVEDDGPGIRDPARVFEPFYTTKPVGKGTGLGLSIAYGIVEEHGGEIRAENLDGRGARFAVRLPLTDRRPIEPPPAEVTPAPVGATHGTVLVVDDEESLIRLQRGFLERLGLACVAARGGEQAVEILKRQSVDFVVSDLRMPGSINGVQLYEWAREHRPFLADRFLFISGDLVTIEAALEDPLPAPCLLKPFRFEQYARALGAFVGTEHVTS